MKKKILLGLLSMALVIAGFAAAFPAQVAEAAGVKGLAAEFMIINDETADWDYNMRTWNTMGEKEMADLSKVTLSYTAYIPISAFKKTVGDDKGINVSSVFAIFTPWNKVKEGADQYNYFPQFKHPDMEMKKDGTIDCWWYNPATDEGEEVPWVSVSKVGDFVKVSVTDAEINPNEHAYSEHYRGEDCIFEGDIAVSDIPGGSYDFDIQTRVEGWGIDADGKYMVTDVVVKYDGNQIFKADYSTKDEIGSYYYRTVKGKEKEGNLKATTLNPTFKVAKSKVSVKAKKSATVKVATHFAGDKVTVKSSNAKVAKASYKGGKITIKGLKKGKAVITVKSNGITKKINVTVK